MGKKSETVSNKKIARQLQASEDAWVRRINALARDLEEWSHSVPPSGWHEAFADRHEAFLKMAQGGTYDPESEHIVPRTLALKCEDDSPAFDQRIQTVRVFREDNIAWYGRDGTLWPKFAWRQVAPPPLASVTTSPEHLSNPPRQLGLWESDLRAS